jgi:hypothetical protein
MEVPAAAAEVAAAKAAHVPPAKAAAEAARVAEVSAVEMSPVAMEMSPVAVESEATVEAVVKAVVEAAASDEDRTTKPVAIVVIRIGVAVTIVVAGAIIRPIVVIAAVRIAGRDAADHSGRDGYAGIVAIAVHVAMSVSPSIMAMACVSVCNAPVRDARVSGIPGVVGDGRRVCGRKRRREDKRGRAERDSRNSKSAKSHGDLPFMLGGAAAPRERPPLQFR